MFPASTSHEGSARHTHFAAQIFMIGAFPCQVVHETNQSRTGSNVSDTLHLVISCGMTRSRWSCCLQCGWKPTVLISTSLDLGSEVKWWIRLNLPDGNGGKTPFCWYGWCSLVDISCYRIGVHPMASVKDPFLAATEEAYQTRRTLDGNERSQQKHERVVKMKGMRPYTKHRYRFTVKVQTSNYICMGSCFIYDTRLQSSMFHVGRPADESDRTNHHILLPQDAGRR